MYEKTGTDQIAVQENVDGRVLDWSHRSREHIGDIGTAALSIPGGVHRLGGVRRLGQRGKRHGEQQADALIAARWLTSAAMYAPAQDGETAVRGSVVVHPMPPDRTATGTDWAALLGQWSDWDVSTMLRIEDCESHFQNVVSAPDYDGIANYGPMQLHGDPRGMEPEYAAARSHEIWLAQGYHAWGCY